MIGKAEWFQRRKYGGWGITPKTWQGWGYIAVMMIPFIIFQSLPIWDNGIRITVTTIWLGVILIDITHIMLTLKRDEREYKIEAISERNASWTMVGVLAIGIINQVVTSGLSQRFAVDWFLIIALFGGMFAKSISNIILERKEI